MNAEELATEILTQKILVLGEVQERLIEEIESMDRYINTGKEFTMFGEPMEVLVWQRAGLIHALGICQSIALTK
jgi:hypothetical protein